MKKIYLLFALSFIATITFSQTTLGFKIGGNADFIETVLDTSPDKTKTTNWFYGIHFGMAANVPLYEDIISFSPELQLRLRSDFDDPLTTYLADVEIPLIFTCYVYPDFGLDLGPEIHYQGINAYKNQDDDWFNNLDDENGSTPKVFDVGISAGARFRISEYAFIAGRFFLGLNNIHPVEDANVKIRNRSAQISFIYTGRGR